MSKKTKLDRFKDAIDEEVLNCPSETTSVKNNFAQAKPYLKNRHSLSREDKKSLIFYEKSMCEAYKNITIKNIINIANACKDIDDTISYINQKINSTTKPALILIGEYHLSSESFLMEASILNELMQRGLSKKLLIEFPQQIATYYTTSSLSSFLALDARNFAHHVLNYKLIGIDKYHPYSGLDVSMSTREEEIKNAIMSISKNSQEKVVIATLGYTHLAAFKQLEQDNYLNVIVLNAAKPSVVERKLSSISVHKTKSEIKELYETIDSFKFIGFKQHLESLSFTQVLDVFKMCNDKKNNIFPERYISSMGLEKCNILNIDDFAGCVPEHLHNDL